MYVCIYVCIYIICKNINIINWTCEASTIAEHFSCMNNEFSLSFGYFRPGLLCIIELPYTLSLQAMEEFVQLLIDPVVTVLLPQGKWNSQYWNWRRKLPGFLKQTLMVYGICSAGWVWYPGEEWLRSMLQIGFIVLLRVLLTLNLIKYHTR